MEWASQRMLPSNQMGVFFNLQYVLIGLIVPGFNFLDINTPDKHMPIFLYSSVDGGPFYLFFIPSVQASLLASFRDLNSLVPR